MSTKERQYKSRLSELSAEVEQLKTKLAQADAVYDEGSKAFWALQLRFDQLETYSNELTNKLLLEKDVNHLREMYQMGLAMKRAENRIITHLSRNYWHRLWLAIIGETV